jgi:hypothetical protein
MSVYHYRTDPIRPALILAGALLLGAILLPSSLVRVILLASAAGALTWAFLQARRRHHTLTLGDAAVTVQHALTGRETQIAYQRLLGGALTDREGVILAYRQAPSAPPAPGTAAQPPLMQARPDPTFTRLLITPPLDDAEALLVTLTARLPHHPEIQRIDPQRLQHLARGRRRRGWGLLILAILAIPFYMYLLWRLIPLLR